ncbi:MAG: DUF3833 family protein [Rhodobacteraceae bacterium]|nr:MAG: DUF3833 family protein [Paracoccaceae bacterium]
MTLFLAFLAGVAGTAAAVSIGARRLGFAGQSPADYAAATRTFDLVRHLDGRMICEGVIFGPTGRVSSRFVADVLVTWDGDSGRMSERFQYSSGETQLREWRLTILANGRIQAEADDLVGIGEGEVSGAGLRLTYRIRLPEGSGGHILDAIDWMYLIDNGTIINRSQFRKYGIKVAELVATIRPVEAADKAREAA